MATATTNTDAAGTHAIGTLAQRQDGQIVLALPHSEYRLNLLADTAGTSIAGAEVGKPITGRIHVNARRVDVVSTGGRFIDPIYGQPRRLQGRVVSTDRKANTITINCSTLITCALMDSQSANQFEAGMLVSFDVQCGARFEVMA